jgi:biotin-(acetyl-CoA carboxylase) ligase
MFPQEITTSYDDRAPSAREHCERILRELEQLYSQFPTKSLMRSIDDVKALMLRLPKEERAPQ